MIKRYFIVPAFALMPPPRCEYHYLMLDQDQCVVVIYDPTIPIPSTWEELPHLLDPVARSNHPKLPQGLNGFELAKHLASIHPKFHP